jgi:hypothetical protein
VPVPLRACRRRVVRNSSDALTAETWPRAASHERTDSRSYSGLLSVPPDGAGKSSCRRRQLLTVARVTPAMREISAAVTWADVWGIGGVLALWSGR